MKLVHKWLTIYALSTRTCASRIPSLHHEIFHNPMKDSPVVVSFLAQLDEIAACAGCLTRPQIDFYLAIRGLEQDLGGRWGLLRLLHL